MCYNRVEKGMKNEKDYEGKKNTGVFIRELGKVKASNTKYFEWVWSLIV